jgi:hypothetical protein
MLDGIAIVSLVLMFALSLLYVRSCDRLKGTRS